MRFSLKRLFDLSVAIILLVIGIPIFMIVWTFVFINLGKPVIFSQSRPGLHGKPFKIFKFRTMTNAKDEKGQLLSDEKRLNRFGLLLRSTSLDELPNLWPIIKGEMSLVGPRPLLMEYLPLYSEEQFRRHFVRPGLTGWAQVNGRNAISWEEKFALDIWYVDHQSFCLDLKILYLTVKKIIFREGINARGEVTMPKFTGNKS